jgi:ArsR family transcriptional regulator, arsenate/arsenite/antimonite-responsive transcriptional repressor
VDRTVALLKALADRNRLRIVLALGAHDELCACQVTGLLEVTGATVSRHLAVLERAGLVQKRRDGRWIWYRLSDTGSAHDLLALIERDVAGDRQVAADRRALRRILSVDAVEYCRRQRGPATCVPGERAR